MQCSIVNRLLILCNNVYNGIIMLTIIVLMYNISLHLSLLRNCLEERIGKVCYLAWFCHICFCFQGVYVNIDEFKSRFRVLSAKFGKAGQPVRHVFNHDLL